MTKAGNSVMTTRAHNDCLFCVLACKSWELTLAVDAQGNIGTLRFRFQCTQKKARRRHN